MSLCKSELYRGARIITCVYLAVHSVLVSCLIAYPASGQQQSSSQSVDPYLWPSTYAVDVQVPLLDMLRYEQIDAGASWAGQHGSVSNPDERAFWERTSPYENLKKDVKYPEAFIWTTTKDDRVGPQHARKFAARMAEQGHPYLFYGVIEGGHGAGANLKERAHTSALEYTYFTRKLIE
jgi:prolyl oligopeptidase